MRYFIIAAIFVLSGCNGGGVKVLPNPAPAPSTAPVTASIVVAVNTTPSSPITGVTVVAKPTTIGGNSLTTSGPCTSTGCSIRANAPRDFTDFTLTLTDASGATVLTGSFGEDVVADGNQPFTVTFGNTPASIALSSTPAYLTIGQSGNATIEVLAYDAQGRRILGNAPFTVPVTIALHDPSGSTSLATTTIANPSQTVTLAYSGASGSTAVLTPTLAGATVEPLEVPIVLGPTTFSGNSVGDMKFSTAEELASIPTAPPAPLVPLTSGRRALASIVDLSSQFPPMGNQGASSSCVAWSSTYAIMTYERNKNQTLTGNGPFGINTATVFSPAYIYNSINGGVDQGLDMTAASRFIVQNGAVPWVSFPWSATDYRTQPSAELLAQGAANAPARFYLVPNGNVNTMKAWLSAGYPILWGSEVDDTFSGFTTAQVWTGPLDGGAAGGHAAGHAMAIVGYDDTKQAFKIYNSWGNDWGAGGMAYISYAWWSEVPGNENFVFPLQ